MVLSLKSGVGKMTDDSDDEVVKDKSDRTSSSKLMDSKKKEVHPISKLPIMENKPKDIKKIEKPDASKSSTIRIKGLSKTAEGLIFRISKSVRQLELLDKEFTILQDDIAERRKNVINMCLELSHTNFKARPTPVELPTYKYRRSTLLQEATKGTNYYGKLKDVVKNKDPYTN